ncbi:MAG: hypothetical protein H7195_01060 [Chryseobacterium sp.]|nr:hypothetical protein [Chryseobacterium sp.]
MKTVEIKAASFFELLKLNGQSMWDVFALMIDGEEQLIIFFDDEEKELFEYLLPKTLGQLKQDQENFSKEYAEKIAEFN